MTTRALLIAAAFAVTAALPACGQATVTDGSVAVWTTSADGSRRLARMDDLALTHGAANAADGVSLLHVFPDRSYQTMVGFGASMTDASAFLIDKLPEAERTRLLTELFGRGEGSLGLDFVRMTIGASDFSSTHYSYDDMPEGETDPELRHFSLAPAEADLIPVMRSVRAINPEVTLMASPWSAPGWMKMSGSLITGKLDPAHYADFAAYLDRYVGAMKDEGLPVAYLTIQNEPHFEPANYPGMRVEPQSRADFVGGHLGPLLAAHGRDTKILDWDHNWNEANSPMDMLADARARAYVAGVAWHCYGGDVSVQSQVHDAYPGKDTFFTECSGGEWAPDWAGTTAWMTRNLIIGATRNWARGVLLWNIALDENHGPHKGGCGDCRGVVTIDSKTGAVTRNMEYYVLGHASRFVLKGAVRVGSDTGVDGLLSVAFRNPDGSLVLIVLNGADGARTLAVQVAGDSFQAAMAAGDIATYVWHAGAGRP